MTYPSNQSVLSKKFDGTQSSYLLYRNHPWSRVLLCSCLRSHQLQEYYFWYLATIVDREVIFEGIDTNKDGKLSRK